MPIEKRGRWADNTRQEVALAHEARRAIVHLVRKLPGIRLHELADATGQTQSGVLWHLRTLERAGFVSAQRHQSIRYYTPPNMAPEGRRLAEAMATLRMYGRQAALLQLVHGPMSRRDLQAELGVSATAAGNLLAYLTREGLATETDHVRLTAFGAKAAAHLPSFDVLSAA